MCSPGTVCSRWRSCSPPTGDGISGSSVDVKKSTFTSTERYMYITEELQLAESMIEAGKEEHCLPIENDKQFQGVPAITVIADGGWSKENHAKSGVAVNMQFAENRLLAKRHLHTCCRNWKG